MAGAAGILGRGRDAGPHRPHRPPAARGAETQEDTQLAFYAALVLSQSPAPDAIEALYLPLDDSDTIKAIEHKGVEASAARLVEGIGRDLARLREGAALPALGEAQACQYCEARGLCRRDHWALVEDAV